MRVLIVGGSARTFRAHLARKLAQVGVEVGWHWDTFGRAESPEDDCAGVVVLRGMSSPETIQAAVEFAEQRAVPLAVTPNRFEDAVRVLRAVGLLKAQARSRTIPSWDAVVGVLRDYIATQHQRGRTVSKQEAQAAVQRAFGPQVTPSEEQVRSGRMAALTVDGPDPITPETLEQWANAAVEARPEADNEALVARVQEMVGDDRVLDPSAVRSAVQEARSRYKARFAVHPKKRAQDEVEFVANAKESWLRRYIHNFRQQHGRMPSWNEIEEEALRVFGSRVQHGMVKRVRDEIEAEPPPPPADAKWTKKVRPEYVHHAVAQAREYVEAMDSDAPGW